MTPEQKAELRRLAEGAAVHWDRVQILLGGNPVGIEAVSTFAATFSPATILALLDALETVTSTQSASHHIAQTSKMMGEPHT
jgi:hypothetical protein